MDFGFFVDEPANIKEFRLSRFYLASENVEWNVRPYEE